MSAAEFRKLLGGDASKHQPANRKIMGATKVEYNGIKFDSQLELAMYQLLADHKVPFEFKRRFEIVSGFRYRGKKIQAITWTPDYYFEGIDLIVDTKGFPSETFSIKLKLFKKSMFDSGRNVDVWSVRKKADLITCVLLIKKRMAGDPDVKSEKFFEV